MPRDQAGEFYRGRSRDQSGEPYEVRTPATETELIVAPIENSLREFTVWFEEKYPTGQNVATPGARLYGIYLRAIAALENRV